MAFIKLNELEVKYVKLVTANDAVVAAKFKLFNSGIDETSTEFKSAMEELEKLSNKTDREKTECRKALLQQRSVAKKALTDEAESLRMMYEMVEPVDRPAIDAQLKEASDMLEVVIRNYNA